MKFGRRTRLRQVWERGDVCAGHREGADGHEARSATVWPDGNFHTKNAKLFAEEVGKVTNGQVQITVHSGGSLGYKGPEQLNAVRDGLVPMADILNIQQVGEAPLLGIEGVPFLVAIPTSSRCCRSTRWPEFVKIATKYNQTILYTVPWPTQYIHARSRPTSSTA